MTSVVEFYSPDTMPPTRGYSQIAHVKGGELLYFSGQVALNAKGELVGADYATQLEQIFRNIELGLKAAGASLENLIKLKPLFMSELRIREIVKRLFTPYQLPLLKWRELTDSTRPRRCRLDKSEREVHENGRFVSRQRDKESLCIAA